MCSSFSSILFRFVFCSIGGAVSSVAGFVSSVSFFSSFCGCVSILGFVSFCCWLPYVFQTSFNVAFKAFSMPIFKLLSSSKFVIL